MVGRWRFTESAYLGYGTLEESSETTKPTDRCPWACELDGASCPILARKRRKAPFAYARGSDRRPLEIALGDPKQLFECRQMHVRFTRVEVAVRLIAHQPPQFRVSTQAHDFDNNGKVSQLVVERPDDNHLIVRIFSDRGSQHRITAHFFPARRELDKLNLLGAEILGAVDLFAQVSSD